MSTQLIVYPQTYDGTYNSTWVYTNPQFVVDGVNFLGINASSTYQSASSIDNHLYATPPAITNTWYRWRQSMSYPAAPLQTGGDLVLNSVAPSSLSGVYQKLSNLIVGANYTLTINMTPASGVLFLKAFNLNTNSLIASSPLSPPTSVAQQTLSFTAQTPNDTVAIIYYNVVNANITISSISLTTTGTSPSGIYTDLVDGQVICDLYEEEDIPLTLSIDDFKNVAEQVKSYSKDFNLPATKRNNRIFNNMFEVTRTDDGLIFNPYVKTKCVLKQDGFLLFEGFLRMINIKDDEGEISYNVNLYSEVISLADTLKEATFSDLDFTELEHDYNITNINRSGNDTGASIIYTNSNTSGFRDAYTTLRYPFIDWTGSTLIADGSTGTAATLNNPELTSLEQAFRPCIQLKYLINKIFANTSFSWTSNFFNSADFEKLYMDFNWGSNISSFDPETGIYDNPYDPATGPLYPLIYSTTSYQNFQLTDSSDFDASLNYDNINHRFEALYNNTQYTITYSLVFWYAAGAVGLDMRWVHKDSGGTIITIYDVATQQTQNAYLYAGSFVAPLQAGDTLQAEFKSDYINVWYQGVTDFQTSTASTIIASIGNIQSNLLQNLRGELGQWDFLKGIMTMFNLVSMVNPDEENNILIEPYSDVFISNINSGDLTLAGRGIQHDWTTKVDVSQMELKTLTDLNKITTFKFVEDDDDYVFNYYKQSTSGHLYGSKVLTAQTSSAFLPTMLVGEKEIIAEPFAATVSKPLYDQFSQFVTPSIYSMNDDGTAEGFDNSPRIFYNNGIKDTGASYFQPAQNGVSYQNRTSFLQFSHMSAIPATLSDSDFVFASEQLFPGVATDIPVNNLYNIYWSPYFNELYNADTRMMTLNVNLTPADINTFKFYDTVFIKNRVFRVNKIEYKPNELAKVEFILLPFKGSRKQ